MNEEMQNQTETGAAQTTPTATQVQYASPSTKRARKGASRLLTPGFLAAVVVLGIAAVGLNATTQFMKLHFKKQAVDIAKPVKDIPTDLGPWKQVSKDEPLESDIEAALATKEYIFRDYVDERVVGKAAIAEFAGKTARERKDLLMKLQKDYPHAIVNLAVTYYTGLVDTVAHIPDRCYIADGYVPSEYKVENWKTGAVNGAGTDVRFINFEDQAGVNNTISRSVAYFFRVNDEYTQDPLRVRRRLQNLFETYGFYSKVELMIVTKDREKAAAMMTDLLSYAIPEIEKCFPDWEKVTGKASGAKTSVAAK
jgi:hypothetical protein